MATRMTWPMPSVAARRSAVPVKSPTSTKHTSGRSGRSRMAAFSDRLPVARTTTDSPWAAATSICWVTEAR